jgi:hypothetical protein
MAPGTLVTGQQGTATVDSARRRIDMADKVLLLEPDAAPLTVLTKNLSKRPAINPKFSWQEDEADPRIDAINNGAGYASGITALVVDNAAYFAAQDVIYCPRTGETMRVTAVNTGTQTLTVVRGVGSTAAALVDNDEIFRLSSAQPEGDASKPARSRNTSAILNYTQIFRTEWDATNTLLTSEFEGGDEWEQQALKHGIEHKKSLEYQFMLGHPSEDTSSGQARRTTGGFAHFVASNVSDVGGTMTEAESTAALRTMFRYGSREKWGIASSLAIDVINSYARGRLQTQIGQSTYGLRVTQYITPAGTLNLVWHPLLEGATLGGQIWVVDLATLAYRYLKNQRGSRDTMVRTNIQAPDVDGRKDEYLTEAGLEFGQEKRHGKIVNITG